MAVIDDLTINEARYADVTVIVPVGRIDQATAAGFQARVLESVGGGTSAVVLDLAGVEYISSVGLRAIMIGLKESKANGGRLTAAGLTPAVREVFDISRFDRILDIHHDVSEALAAISDAAVQAYGAD